MANAISTYLLSRHFEAVGDKLCYGIMVTFNYKI